jgi:hypothetical protein
MWTPRFLLCLVFVVSAAGADAPLPFRAADGRWGYRTTQSIVIPPRFAAAGRFVSDRALVRTTAGDFVFLSPTGDTVGRLEAADASPLPNPKPALRSLSDYAAQLKKVSREYELLVEPAAGEQHQRLFVQALEGGVIAIREVGWEGEDFILVLPRSSREDAKRLAAAIFGSRLAKTARADVFDNEPAYEIAEPEVSAEFVRIRERRGGAVELIHTRWFG